MTQQTLCGGATAEPGVLAPEALAPAGGRPAQPFTRLTVADRLRAARTRAELVAAAQRIQHVPDTSDQTYLAHIVRLRLDEFKGK